MLDAAWTPSCRTSSYLDLQKPPSSLLRLSRLWILGWPLGQPGEQTVWAPVWTLALSPHSPHWCPAAAAAASLGPVAAPTVLQVRAWKLKRNFKYCSDRFGVESARRLPVFYWKASMVTLKRACDRKEESGVM